MSREFWQTLRRSLITFPGEPVDTRMAAVGKGILTAFLLCVLLGVLVAVLVPEVSVSAKNVAGAAIWILSIAVGIWTAKRAWPPAQSDQIRLRFSIRDLLWLTVVAALGVGWWLDHAALERKLDSQIVILPTNLTIPGTINLPAGSIDADPDLLNRPPPPTLFEPR
jgi:ABC-type uncharacterized transport system permease subunit